MVCGSFVCVYRSQCVAFEVQGTDACYGAPCNGNDECANFLCQVCENTYCNSFLLPDSDDLDIDF